jgi:hypothetical protein
MNFLTYLKQNLGILLWFAIVIMLIYGYNVETTTTKEYFWFGFYFDLIVPFASGMGIAYHYATWKFNKPKD